MPEFYDLARYDSELRSVIESIFSGISISDAADDDMYLVFAHADWRVVGLPRDVHRAATKANSEPVDPQNAESEDGWVPLFETLRRSGEHDLFISARPEDTERPVERVLAAACKFDQPEFQAAERVGHFLVYEEHLIFGRNPDWGMVTHWESFTILGGSKEFMAAYVAAAGGVESVRRRFENQIDFQFRSPSGKSKEDRFADRIVRSIRWPA